MANSVKSTKSVVTSSNSEKEFNNWEFVKERLVKAFLEQNRPEEFEVNFKFMDEFTTENFHTDGARRVLDYLESKDAFEYSKPRKITIQNGEDTKTVWTIKVKNFDLKHQSAKKDGGSFFTFKSAYAKAQSDIEFYGAKA